MKSERVSMPMGSAGILGVSADMKLGGIEIDPRTIIIATLLFVGIVKIADILVAQGITV